MNTALSVLLCDTLANALVSPFTNDKPVALIVGIGAVALIAVVALILTRKKK